MRYGVWIVDSYATATACECIGVGFTMAGAGAIIRDYRRCKPGTFCDVRVLREDTDHA